MDEKQSLKDTIARGFYRYLTNDGGIKLTNGKVNFKLREFALVNQHFENGKKGRIIHLFEDKENKEPWPVIELTVDFSKPFGKIPNESLLNIAPPAPIQSENNNEDTSIFWKHIENLCGNVDQDTKEWVKDWLADIFQNPIVKSGTALTFRSDEGTGKGLLFDNLMSKLLGERHLSTCCAVFGERFNGDLKNKLLINFDEGSWGNGRNDIGALKKFITDKTFPFEEKGKDRLTLPNFARTVFTSNESWIMKNDGSRRFCMLNPIKEDYCSKEYFDNLILAIEDENKVKKFLYELENRTITHSLRIIPKTEEYYNQEVLSYDYFDSWLQEIFEEENYTFYGVNPMSGVDLWIESSEFVKSCTPDTAVLCFNNLYKNMSITKSKLLRRIKDKTKNFGFKVDSVVKNINGNNKRVWEFTKIIKQDNKITEITDITQITENSGSENKNNLQGENASVIVNSVIEGVENKIDSN
jgi:hypothetical protein